MKEENTPINASSSDLAPKRPTRPPIPEGVSKPVLAPLDEALPAAAPSRNWNILLGVVALVVLLGGLGVGLLARGQQHSVSAEAPQAVIPSNSSDANYDGQAVPAGTLGAPKVPKSESPPVQPVPKPVPVVRETAPVNTEPVVIPTAPVQSVHPSETAKPVTPYTPPKQSASRTPSLPAATTSATQSSPLVEEQRDTAAQASAAPSTGGEVSNKPAPPVPVPTRRNTGAVPAAGSSSNGAPAASSKSAQSDAASSKSGNSQPQNIDTSASQDMVQETDTTFAPAETDSAAPVSTPDASGVVPEGALPTTDVQGEDGVDWQPTKTEPPVTLPKDKTTDENTDEVSQPEAP